MNPEISEAQISALVDAFYAKVRQDPEIGPIFNAIVDDWPYHLALLKDFWSSVLLATGRYKGNPMMRHFQLGLDPQHFERWLYSPRPLARSFHRIVLRWLSKNLTGSHKIFNM
jgi:hemoglobin